MNSCIYLVLPDFDIPPNGVDEIDFSPEIPNNEMAAAICAEVATSWDSSVLADWRPAVWQYARQGETFAKSDFLKLGSFILATADAQRKLKSLSDIEWLPMGEVRGLPDHLRVSSGSPFYLMRFATMVVPHKKSKIVYYPGTEGIGEIRKLFLKQSDLDLYAFRLKGDPIALYVTEHFVRHIEGLGLQGMEFNPVSCEVAT